MAERALAEKLQEDLRLKTAEADKAKAEVEQLNELVAQLQDTTGQSTRERAAAARIQSARESSLQRPAAAAATDRHKDAGAGDAGSAADSPP